MIGSQVGPYTVVGKLGAGGMGEVYRATDSRLQRDVALKILPEDFAADSQRLARFEREAQVLASLNHPNIGAIYGLEENDGRVCLVLELIEGRTLAEELEGGPVAQDTFLECARQMAEALEVAHEQGVVHRDLKPANVKITPDGTVKILDFGLAKPTVSAADDGELSNSPTLAAAATQAGFILGTAAYMSPEQAAGKPVDRRTDIWSFGAVLFEMLTGERLYDTSSIPETLASVIAREPDLSTLPSTLSPRIGELVRRCLRKDPRSRLRDMGDARVALEDELAGVGYAVGVAEPATDAGSRRGGWTWLAASLALATVAAAIAWNLKTTDKTEPRLLKFGIPVFERVETGVGPSLSPDGSRVAYRSDGRLRVRELGELEAVEIEGTDTGMQPFWSEDGNWIAYASGVELWKVPAVGGEAVMLTEAEEPFTTAGGGAWLADGTIVFSTGDGGLFSVSEHGGEPEIVLEPAEGERDFHDPTALADGRGLLFVVHGPVTYDTIAVLVDGERHDVLTMDGQRIDEPKYAASHLVFAKRGGQRGIWAVPFSLTDLEATGEPFRMVPEASEPTVNGSDLLAYVSSREERSYEFVILDRQGDLLQVVESEISPGGLPSLSPDGSRLLFQAESLPFAAWLFDLERGTQTRVTSERGHGGLPRWVDDDRFVYIGGSQEGPECYLASTDGGGDPQKVAGHLCMAVSSDGETVIYGSGDPRSGVDLFHGPLGGEVLPLLVGDATTVGAEFSPSARHLVYQSDESGREEIYLQGYPEAGRRWRVSNHGGHWPRWVNDEIFYRHDGSLWAVSVVTDPEVELGAPERLFDLPDTLGLGFSNWPDAYDAWPDGERFVMRRPRGDEIFEQRVVVVQDWLSELTSTD